MQALRGKAYLSAGLHFAVLPSPPQHHHHLQVNAGQANAATGEQGYQDSLASADAVAKALGVSRDDVLLESTGVIGR